MNFSHKVFFSTLLIIALICGLGNAVLVDSMFRSAMDREEQIALGENKMLQFSFVTAVSNAVATADLYGLIDPMSDSAIRRIGWTVENSSGVCIRISDAEGNRLYVSKAFKTTRDLAAEVAEGGRAWICFAENGSHYIQVACPVRVGERVFYLESLRNVDGTIQEHQRNLALCRALTLSLMALSAVLMLLLSKYLTRPLQRLSAVSRRIAGGEYQLRCAVVSHDEIGALTEDFNAMADSVETKICELEDASRRQEDFVASFAHELKTPLTSIIGYSDMLRSQVLPPEQQFKAAEYIYAQGKRLESLSHKLLEIIVYRRETISPAPIQAKPWLEKIAATLEPSLQERGLHLDLSVDEGVLWGESDLLESLVFNLCDNARKASPEGAVVELRGCREEAGYCISVRDHGSGIPPEALLRITEPFYMVDKSRSRTQNGAGLGLALCAAVAEVHGTSLHFDSALGRGTTVSIHLKGVAE